MFHSATVCDADIALLRMNTMCSSVVLFQEEQNLYPMRYLAVSEKIPIETGLSGHTAGSGSTD